MKKLDNYDWYCNCCNECLNYQSGFNTSCGTWRCTVCGELNPISEDSILEGKELYDFEHSGYESYNEYCSNMSEEESLSVYDAALIWMSHGKDEDYTFGYSESELEDALK